MIKLIQLKLLKIKYDGDSVGDDIRAEVEILNKFLRIDKIIKINETAEINKEIGNFETDRKSFETKLRITVIEKDLLFNDIASINGNIKIDTSIIKPQQFIYKVQIRETRSIFEKFWGKKSALFEITLEVLVTDIVRYVPNENNGKGWLKVRIEDNKTIESLPAFLKVKPKYSDNKREYFIPLEGVYRDKLVSSRLQDDGSSNLIPDMQHDPMARVSYSISKRILTINGKTYATVDYKNAPWEKGLYDIEIPDYPHSLGSRYEKEAPRAKTWFRVGHRGDRYLHTGGRSLGCITVIETKRWAEIYDALIRARKGDSASIGTLEIIN